MVGNHAGSPYSLFGKPPFGVVGNHYLRRDPCSVCGRGVSGESGSFRLSDILGVARLKSSFRILSRHLANAQEYAGETTGRDTIEVEAGEGHRAGYRGCRLKQEHGGGGDAAQRSHHPAR